MSTTPKMPYAFSLTIQIQASYWGPLTTLQFGTGVDPFSRSMEVQQQVMADVLKSFSDYSQFLLGLFIPPAPSPLVTKVDNLLVGRFGKQAPYVPTVPMGTSGPG